MPAAAAAKSASSGMLAHNRYDMRGCDFIAVELEE
ncbi:unnamed protein product, partial [marine sediment metagenome]